MTKRGVKNPLLYELDGPEALGSTLRITPRSDNAPEISMCTVQWYRVSPEGGKTDLISGILHLEHVICLVDFVSAVCYSKMSAGPINHLLLACNI